MYKNHCDSNSLVSIIMPTYNCDKFIIKAINSVINQTYKNWELIVVDDYSMDKTYDILQNYIDKDNRIKYFKLYKNSGAAIARNKAIEVATGKYIAFLDSDDIWIPEKLSKQIKYMEENQYNFTCTSFRRINENEEALRNNSYALDIYDYDTILKRCPGNSTIVYNAEKLGKFKIPDIKKRNDYVMWLQIIKKEKYLYGIKEVLTNYRVREGSLSKDKRSLIPYNWKVYREIEKLSLLKASYLIIYLIITTIFKLR